MKYPVLVIGQMSGTSADGVDSVLLCIDDMGNMTVEDSLHQDYLPEIKNEINALCKTGKDEIDRSGRLSARLAHIYAKAAIELRQANGNPKITVIGCHGQTVRHQPHDEYAYTLQLCQGPVIAALTGITTVSDFRQADIAAGGEGAPLTPAFHQAMFATAELTRAIINIGGLSNITILPAIPEEPVTGYDTGPGNTLLDLWYRDHHNGLYDRTGTWAASGKVDDNLLSCMMMDPYFELPPPKSTGREYFHMNWLEAVLERYPERTRLKSEDVQATLCALTAKSIQKALFSENVDEVYLCGGGCFNDHLVDMIRSGIDIPVNTTAALRIDPMHVEAAAFGWIAWRTLNRLPSSLASVTGARSDSICGVISYPSTKKGAGTTRK